ncbi:hypothetical protein NEF87_003846 [Candidatus Lokiarchaeum ossiferum]|uniref:Uncharacterized protein n=1 Tax=Candidatus Lokiarchaeum ossiferum TaxID=2951803 RepID=A0ABY6HVK7_9ARCH|nr:hypothetical protein NEF87_003846 [Candidatus Lokiarchaeum sp. B-35]
MTENVSDALPDITNALHITQQYEEYNFLRLWGIFLLIDSLIFLSSLIPIFLITHKVYYFYNNPGRILRIGLNFVQYLLVFILLMRRGRSKKTSVKLGKMKVSFNWLFLGGLILIFLLRSLLNLITNFFSFSFWGYPYYYFTDIIILSLTTLLYYNLMRKIISQHNFKELKIITFVLFGWIAALIILLPILKIDEFFKWDEIYVPLSGPETDTIQSSDLFPIFQYIVSQLTTFIFLVCEFRSGMIALRKSNELLKK